MGLWAPRAGDSSSMCANSCGISKTRILGQLWARWGLWLWLALQLQGPGQSSRLAWGGGRGRRGAGGRDAETAVLAPLPQHLVPAPWPQRYLK